MITPKKYQVALTQMLMAEFKPAPVTSSWRPFEGMGRRIYQPIADIAIGPFATEGQYITEYDDLVQDKSNLIDVWAHMFQSNWQEVIGDHYFAVPPPKPTSYEDYLGINSNQNARCFMAMIIVRIVIHFYFAFTTASSIKSPLILAYNRFKCKSDISRMGSYINELK